MAEITSAKAMSYSTCFHLVNHVLFLSVVKAANDAIAILTFTPNKAAGNHLESLSWLWLTLKITLVWLAMVVSEAFINRKGPL